MKYHLGLSLCFCMSLFAQSEVRDHSVGFSVTWAEAKALMGAAEEAHLELGDFVRMKVMQGIEIRATEQVDSAKPEVKPTPKMLLPEWKVSSGTWASKGGVVSGQAGIMEWTGKAKDTVEISFSVKVDKWVVGRSSIAMIWNAGHKDKLRNLIVFKRDTIRIIAQPEPPNFKAQTVGFGIPDGKIVRIRATLTRKGIAAVVGRKKVAVKIPAEQVGKLQLYINGPNASFSSIQVQTAAAK